jgi:putative tryptophan/tyrosine transport system substrate-binding protein
MRRWEFSAGRGSAAAWRLAAQAQQAAVPVIGFLSGITESAAQPLTSAFRRGLAEQGFVDGWSVEILYSSADTHYDRLPLMAAEMVAAGLL